MSQLSQLSGPGDHEGKLRIFLLAGFVRQQVESMASRSSIPLP